MVVICFFMTRLSFMLQLAAAAPGLLMPPLMSLLNLTNKCNTDNGNKFLKRIINFVSIALNKNSSANPPTLLASSGWWHSILPYIILP